MPGGHASRAWGCQAGPPVCRAADGLQPLNSIQAALACAPVQLGVERRGCLSLPDPESCYLPVSLYPLQQTLLSCPMQRVPVIHISGDPLCSCCAAWMGPNGCLPAHPRRPLRPPTTWARATEPRCSSSCRPHPQLHGPRVATSSSGRHKGEEAQEKDILLKVCVAKTPPRLLPCILMAWLPSRRLPASARCVLPSLSAQGVRQPAAGRAAGRGRRTAAGAAAGAAGGVLRAVRQGITCPFCAATAMHEVVVPATASTVTLQGHATTVQVPTTRGAMPRSASAPPPAAGSLPPRLAAPPPPAGCRC